MIPLLSIALAACMAVSPDSDRVTARDLLPAWPELAVLDPSTALAFAPAPGIGRVFRAADFRALAEKFGLSAVPEREICVERPATPLDPARLLAAMQRVLPEARIEILEYSRQAAPAGEIQFTRQGLHNGTLWNGTVRYAGNRAFAIWARVKIVAQVQRVVAATDLKPERAIEPGDVAVQTREEFPADGSFVQSLDQVVGKWTRFAVRAGAEIRSEQLCAPKEVARGETVRVDVTGGAAHLDFEGIAESSGGVGEFVQVRNPGSGRRFRARVSGKGRVSVDSTLAKVGL